MPFPDVVQSLTKLPFSFSKIRARRALTELEESRAGGACGENDAPPVWKPAIRQIWKSALRRKSRWKINRTRFQCSWCYYRWTWRHGRRQRTLLIVLAACTFRQPSVVVFYGYVGGCGCNYFVRRRRCESAEGPSRPWPTDYDYRLSYQRCSYCLSPLGADSLSS